MRSLGLGMLLGVLVGCGGVNGVSTSAVTSLTGDATSGQTLYTANCERCHGANATSGTANRNLPSAAKSDASTAASFILSGEDEMPSFASTLTNQQIADILAYLKSL